MSTVNIIEGLAIKEQPEIKKKNSMDGSEVSLPEIFKEKLKDVNNLQIQSDESTKQLITGEADNVHEVLLNTEEAVLTLELAVKVRNKIVEAYQEVIKMQI
jgi:flagellar hook-basal body complex protein FliE